MNEHGFWSQFSSQALHLKWHSLVKDSTTEINVYLLETGLATSNIVFK